LNLKKPLLPATILFVVLRLSEIQSSASSSPQDVGFKPNRLYDNQLSVSVDLLSLNPIARQPLSPSLAISEVLSMQAIADHTGLTWTQDGQQSWFSLDRPQGILGAGWYLGVPHMYSDLRWYSGCNLVYHTLISEQGADHPFTLGNHSIGISTDDTYTRISGEGDLVPQACADQRWVTEVVHSPDGNIIGFDPNNGAALWQEDAFGNRLTYSYMTAQDFWDIDHNAQPVDYDYSWNRAHPVSGELALDQYLPPKRIDDSLGRYISFRYSKIENYSKFLLTEIDVPTPNGRGVYKLKYQMRTIANPPLGWPPSGFAPVPRPFLVSVELPEAQDGQGSLTYHYDYNASGEISSIHYPTGSRIALGWTDVLYAYTLGPLRGRGLAFIDRNVDPGGPSVRWSYTKNLYPPCDNGCNFGSEIRNRERTILTDPAGNDTEFRLLTTFSADPYGAVGGIRIYKGNAPRYVLSGNRLEDSLSDVDPNYNGLLIRSKGFHFQCQISGGRDCSVFSTVTQYYDDPLNNETPAQLNDPGSWFSEYLESEMYVGGIYSLRPGYASGFVHGDPNYWQETHKWGGSAKTTESGNMVGLPRMIEGWYRLPSILDEGTGTRKISQGAYSSRVDRELIGGVLHEKHLMRLDGVPSLSDVTVKYAFDFPASGPTARHSLKQVVYSGGHAPDPNTPSIVTPDHVINMTYQYGALARKTYGSFTWNDVNESIASTGHPIASYDRAEVRTDHVFDDLGRLIEERPTSPELPTYTVHLTGSESFDDSRGYGRLHRYSRGRITSRGTSGTSGYIEEYVLTNGIGQVTLIQRLTASGQRVQQKTSYDDLGVPIYVTEWHAVDDFQPPQQPPGTAISYYDPSDGNPNTEEYREPFSRPRRVTKPDGSVSSIRYFGNSSEVSVSDIKGMNGSISGSIIFYRDYMSRLRIVDAPEGADAVYSYDHFGNLVRINLVEQVQLATYSTGLDVDRFKVLNSDGQVRQFEYDALGRLITTSYPERGSTGYSYDAAGRVIRVVDSAGSEFRTTYDQAGRRIVLEGKGSSQNVFRRLSESIFQNEPVQGSGLRLGKLIEERSYEDSGQLVSTRFLYYDPNAPGGLNGRMTSERWEFPFWQDGPVAGVTSRYEYDDSGMLQAFTYPLEDAATRTPTRVRYSYSHGLLTRLESNRGDGIPGPMSVLIDAVGYNASGAVTSVRFTNGVDEFIGRDASSRPTSISVAKGSENYWASGLYSYDGAGNVGSIGNQEFAYDLVGRLRRAETALVSTPYAELTQEYTYDIYGNMRTRADSSGVLGDQEFVLDPNRNQVRVLNPAGTALNYFYDPRGALINNGIQGFSWDTRGRLNKVTTVDFGSTLAEYLYDSRNYRIRTATDASARQTVFVRDSMGTVLSEFSRPTSSIVFNWKKDFIYAADRHVAVVENAEPDTPTGLRSCYPTNCNNSAPHFQWLSSSASDVYGYDVYRTRYGTTERLRITTEPVANTTFTDTAAGLVSGERYLYEVVAVDNADNESPGTAGRRIRIGDVTPPQIPVEFTGEAISCNSIMLGWNVIEESVEQSELVGYNIFRRVLGDTTWPTAARNGSIPHQGSSYLDSSPLSGGGPFEFGLEAVDAAGNRSEKALVTVIMAPIEECGSGGGWAGLREVEGLGVLKSSTHRLIGTGEVQSRILYFHVDHLGTPRVVTDANGVLIAKKTFFPFGESVPNSQSYGNALFSGHERDYEFDGDYMRARYSSLVTARMITPDVGRIVLSNPQSANLYVLSRNNPISYIDPDGREAYQMYDKVGWKHGVVVTRDPSTGQLTAIELFPKSYPNSDFQCLAYCDGDVYVEPLGDMTIEEYADLYDYDVTEPFMTTEAQDQAIIDYGQSASSVYSLPLRNSNYFAMEVITSVLGPAGLGGPRLYNQKWVTITEITVTGGGDPVTVTEAHIDSLDMGFAQVRNRHNLSAIISYLASLGYAVYLDGARIRE
jgi:RHS repeat-associated protein